MKRSLYALLFALAGCATDPTEVMLVVDGDFDVPTEVDSLEITVTTPDGLRSKTATAPLDAANGFPRILGIVRGDGGDGDYLVTVVAKRGLSNVVTRRASFVFRKEEIRRLEVHLLPACQGVVCSGSDRTCGEAGICERIQTDTEEWTGPTPSEFDAGMSIGPIVGP